MPYTGILKARGRESTEEDLETHGGGRSPRPEEKMAGSEGPGKERSETEKLLQGPVLHIGVTGMKLMTIFGYTDVI
jgi:hypothetical protein